MEDIGFFISLRHIFKNKTFWIFEAYPLGLLVVATSPNKGLRPLFLRKMNVKHYNRPFPPLVMATSHKKNRIHAKHSCNTKCSAKRTNSVVCTFFCKKTGACFASVGSRRLISFLDIFSRNKTTK